MTVTTRALRLDAPVPAKSAPTFHPTAPAEIPLRRKVPAVAPTPIRTPDPRTPVRGLAWWLSGVSAVALVCVGALGITHLGQRRATVPLPLPTEDDRPFSLQGAWRDLSARPPDGNDVAAPERLAPTAEPLAERTDPIGRGATVAVPQTFDGEQADTGRPHRSGAVHTAASTGPAVPAPSQVPQAEPGLGTGHFHAAMPTDALPAGPERTAPAEMPAATVVAPEPSPAAVPAASPQPLAAVPRPVPAADPGPTAAETGEIWPELPALAVLEPSITPTYAAAEPEPEREAAPTPLPPPEAKPQRIERPAPAPKRPASTAAAPTQPKPQPFDGFLGRDAP